VKDSFTGFSKEWECGIGNARKNDERIMNQGEQFTGDCTFQKETE
jgi:hypothetical protein